MIKDITVVEAGWPWEDKFAPAPGVCAGDFMFLSGNPPFDAQGELVHPGDLIGQAEQIYANMADILARRGLGMEHIVKMTAFFTVPMTHDDAKALWAVRQRFFGTHRPASVGVQVSSLLFPEMVIEIDAIAYMPGGER